MSDIANGAAELSAFVEGVLVESLSKIFRVNVNTGGFEVYKDDGFLDGAELIDNAHLAGAPDIYTYVERLITAGIIYPEYATACRRFTNPEYVRKCIFSGDKRIVQSYRRRTNRGDRWITFAIIASGDCDPANPVALYTWREADSDAITLMDTLPTISSLYDKLIRINLSNNTYEPVIVDDDEQERLVGGVINMYEWWAGYSKDGNIASEDMSAFSALTKAGSLQKRFAEDPTPVSFRYRRKQGDEFRWVQLEIAPSVEYSEDNQIMLLSLKDIHEEYTAQMRSRQELIDNMNRDALTRLFNRLKFNADIDALQKSGEPLFTCLYIDVNGLHELNNHLGHQKGDDMLCCVADTLRKYFPDEWVYRIGGDEFVVTSVRQSKQAVEQTVEQVRQELHRDHYEISVGVETGSCGDNIEKIVAAAELLMRNDKAAYYMRNGDRRKNRSMNEELEKMLAQKHDNERFLNIIAHQFSGVFFVDLTRDTLRHIYIPDFFARLLKEENDCFSAAMRRLVGEFVQPAYRARFDELLDFDALDRQLRGSGAVQFTYEKTDGTRMSVRVFEVERRENARPETLWIFEKSH